MTQDEEVLNFKEFLSSGNVTVRNKLLDSQMGLIVNMARKFTKNQDLQNDLINEGVLGVLKYMGKFDLEQNLRFSSYAAMCARGAMLIYMQSNSDILGIGKKLRKEGIIKALSKEDHTNWTHKHAAAFAEDNAMSLWKVLAVLGCLQGNDNEVLDSMHHTDDIEKEIIEYDLRDKIFSIVNEMNENDKQCFYHMYYNVDGDELSHQEIANRMDKSKAWVSLRLHIIKNRIVEKFI